MIKDYFSGRQIQDDALTRTVEVSSATANGDLLILIIAFSDVSASSLSGLTGWTALKTGVQTGTMKTSIYWTVRGTGESYTYTRSDAGQTAHQVITIKGRDDTQPIIVGANGTRAASGADKSTTAPSITTTASVSRAYVIGTERTNGAELATPPVNNGFIRDTFSFDASNIHTIFIGHKDVGSGATGDTTIGPYYNTHASNAFAVQIGIVDAGTIPEDPEESPVYVLDTFNRTLSGTWGEPDVGPAYSFGGLSTGFSVGEPGGIISRADSSPAVYMPIAAKESISMRMKMTHDKLPVGGGTLSTRMVVRDLGLKDYHLRQWVRADGTRDFVFARSDEGYVGSIYTHPTVYVPGTSYWVKAEAVGINPTTLRAKIWTGEENDEPATWTITETDSSSEHQASGSAAFRWILGGGPVTNTPITTFIDNLLVRAPEGTTSVIRTGQVKTLMVVNLESTSFTVGAIRGGGLFHQLMLVNMTSQAISYHTMSYDIYGWGCVTLMGLSPNTSYLVGVNVDGAAQNDAAWSGKTLPQVPSTFKAVAGSCQFTGSNHRVWNAIYGEQPKFLAHMGDMHYNDASDVSIWRSGMESSLQAPYFESMLGAMGLVWTPDNHDRVIVNESGAGTGLNLGTTDPITQESWKKLAGTEGWASPDTLGRTWVVGRVRFIQTDMWSARDDADGDPSPRTFLGPAQKTWFKNTLANATEVMVVWLCSWTAKNNANGRWNSFPEETAELEAFIDARPNLKAKLVMIGGDSHSLQADDGSRPGDAGGYRFPGIPSLNISGFNRSGDAGDGSTGWSIANAALRTVGQPEADWGGYSKMTFTDIDGTLTFLWEAIRVDAAGVKNTMASFTKSYTAETPAGFAFLELFEWDGTSEFPIELLG